LWRSDEEIASHPTFSLVLGNRCYSETGQVRYFCVICFHRICTHRYVLNTSDIDPNITMKEIRDASEGDPLTKVTEKVLNSAQIHSSNIPGTPANWRSTYHEMQATDFYFSYIEGEETNAFATGSLAE